MTPDQSEIERPLPDTAQSADAAREGFAAARPFLVRARWVAMVAVALALGGLWLARDVSGGRPAHHADQDAVGSAASGSIGQPVRLDVRLKDLNGAGVTLADFIGKIVVLNFWATWCGPCKAEIPDLVSLQAQYPKDLVILGAVILDPIGPHTRPFVTRFGINYRVLDANGRADVEEAYGPIWGLPTSVIIGRDGRVMQRFAGARSKAQFEREIRALH